MSLLNPSEPRSADHDSTPPTDVPPKKLEECDLVMKGGITSGVVYPPAVLKLSDRYRFRSVGGASAGAIAAAMTVAAEYGRQAKTGEKFAGIQGVQRELLRDNFIASLFQPAGEARFLFDTLMIAQEIDMSAGWRKAAPELLRLVGRVIAGLWQVRKGLRCVNSRGSFFGFCTGLAAEGEGEQLTDWLHRRIGDLSGKAAKDGPLTCADLKLHGIYLKVVTTNLSKAQPMALPTKDRSFLFKEEEFRRLFPADVVDYLIEKSASYTPSARVDLPAGYHRLPAGGDLPVLVAARMSLSFPVLLSAVPLYTLRGSAYHKAKKGPKGDRGATPEGLDEHWFSDGGIANNFPIQFFDTWLPGRPTFGLTLADSPLPGVLSLRERPRKEDLKGKAKLVIAGSDVDGEPGEIEAMMSRARDTDDIRVLLPTRKIGGLGSFMVALFDTAQSYRDNMQAVLPSYRERIATVFLGQKEGGLNLRMEGATVEKMMAKGGAAADLIDRFNLDEHRWVRFLVLMSQVERELNNMRLDANGQVRPLGDLQAEFQDLMDAMTRSHSAEAFYRAEKDPEWTLQAERRMNALFTLMAEWGNTRPYARPVDARVEHVDANAAYTFFQKNAPRPEPTLRVTSEL